MPLIHLDQDLRNESLSAINLDWAFYRYLQSQLGMDEDAAMQFGGQLDSKSQLPDINVLAYDRPAAIEQYRAAIVNHVVPFFEQTHSPEEVDEWLPVAYRTAVPLDGRHVPEDCEQGQYGEGCCKIGRCAVRAIHEVIIGDILLVDFTELDYVYDAERQSRNVMRRLDAAVKVGILDEESGTNYALRYLHDFEATFPIIS
jgi:hypothetical protein